MSNYYMKEVRMVLDYDEMVMNIKELGGSQGALDISTFEAKFLENARRHEHLYGLQGEDFDGTTYDMTVNDADDDYDEPSEESATNDICFVSKCEIDRLLDKLKYNNEKPEKKNNVRFEEEVVQNNAKWHGTHRKAKRWSIMEICTWSM
eukprot:13784211-Heterocapsa_arctica.AAC.1